MRIYLPSSRSDREQFARGSSHLELDAGRAAFAATDSVRAEQPGTDDEDLEYEALQEAAFVALSETEPHSRALVIAAEVPARAITGHPEQLGAFGLTLGAGQARIVAFHVTEQTATAAAADDTDPALLWFDAAEPAAALDYLGGGALE